MLKVGLITYHFSNNFGALMQAYALRKWFLNQGVDAEFLPYHPRYVEEGGAFDRPWKLSLWRKNATILYMKLNYVRHRLFDNAGQRAAFQAFRRKYLGVGSLRCVKRESLEQYVRQYDMLVCGSDQIWNPSIQRGLDPIYFLQIPGSSDVRKVAYAPSFGRTEIEGEHLPDLTRYLAGLDAISVRERNGLEILTKAGVTNACVVPDPTILLGDFSDLTGSEVVSDSSVFCYALRSDELIRDVALLVARQSGCSLRSARNLNQKWRDIGQGVSLGPLEWLQMLNQSRFVISNSFHGVALSVILNKPFIAVSLPGKKAALNARTLNLLETVGLMDRFVTSIDPEHVASLYNSPIDWGAVNNLIAEQRKIGGDFLWREIALTET